jgi:hypothetical protein
MKKNIFVKSSAVAFLFSVMIVAYPRISLAEIKPYVTVPANTTITPVAPAPTYTSPSTNTGLPVGSTTSSATGTPIGSSTSGATGTGVYIPTAAETGLSGAGIQAILTNLLRWLLGIVGVVALIGFAISGVQYILAAGNDKIIETAKKNMVNSIIGIVVVLASLVIVQAIDFALRGTL